MEAYGKGEDFDKQDMNHDGIVSTFEALDKDHDGELSMSEFQAGYNVDDNSSKKGIKAKKTLFKTISKTKIMPMLVEQSEKMIDKTKSFIQGMATGESFNLALNSSSPNAHFLELANSQDTSTHPLMSCRGRCVGTARIVLAIFFMLSFLLILAISIAVVLSINFLVAKAQFHQESTIDYQNIAIIWTVFTPWIMILFALLMEKAQALILDTIINNPLNSINTHDRHSRYQFIYTASGGERPLLLRYRATGIAILAALFVKNQSRRIVSQNVQTRQREPLFQIPEWITGMSEVFFLVCFLVWPLVYTIFGQALHLHRYHSYIPAFMTAMLFISLFTIVFSCIMDLMVYLWPRASRIRAFITGYSTAHFAFSPYIENISSRQVLRTPVKQGSVDTCEHEEDKIEDKREDKREEREDKREDKREDPSKNQNQEENKVSISKRQRKKLRLALTAEAIEQMISSSSDVVAFDKERYQMYDQKYENNDFEFLQHLNLKMRQTFQDHVSPRLWFAVGSPIDILWDRCCSKITICRLCCRFCCVNRKWHYDYAKHDARCMNRLSGKSKYTHSNLKIETSSLVIKCEKCWKAGNSTCGQLTYKSQFAWTFLLFCLLIGLSLVRKDILSTVQILLAMTVLSLGKSFRMVAPTVFRRSFQAFLVIQVLVQFFIAGLAHTSTNRRNVFIEQKVSFVASPPTPINAVPSVADATIASDGWPFPTQKMLPVCDARWGKNRHVSILDIGVLIAGIYDTVDFGLRAVTDAFQGGALSDVQLNTTEVQGEKSSITWQRWDFNREQTSVFVVRGTLTTFDAMQDIAIYALSSSIELVSHGWSLDAVLPTRLLSDLIDIVSNHDFEIDTHHELRDAITIFRQNHPKESWTTIVAGHSLGGAYANILAALLEIPSVSFSPPGLEYVSRSVGIDAQQLSLARSYITSIIPEHDLVTSVDKQIGTRVDIPCTAPLDSTASGAQCHAPMRTLSTLVMACPDSTSPYRRWSLMEDFYGAGGETNIMWYLGGPDKNADVVAWPFGWRKSTKSPK